MSDDDLVFANGTVRFSRHAIAWYGHGNVINARQVTETAPNGGIYTRLATAIEDLLLDALLASNPIPDSSVETE